MDDDLQITPEMQQQIMAQQMQQGQAPQGQPQTPPQQMQQPMTQEPQMQQAPSPEDITTAKKMLGMDVIEQQLATMTQQNIQLEAGKKYPTIPHNLVEQEIVKIEATNPALAQSMRATPEGMEMAYRAVSSGLVPKEKPDDLTNDSGNSDAKDTLMADIKSGKATEMGLGDYILSNSK